MVSQAQFDAHYHTFPTATTDQIRAGTDDETAMSALGFAPIYAEFQYGGTRLADKAAGAAATIADAVKYALTAAFDTDLHSTRGGGLYRESSALEAADYPAASYFQTANGRYFLLDDPRPTFEMCGAIGDGAEDDLSALQAAHDWSVASGRKIHGTDGAIYMVTDTVTVSGEHQADWGTSKIYVTANERALEYDGGFLGPFDLTGNYTAGDATIEVSNTGPAVTAGSQVLIISDAVDPANRDSGSEATQYRNGEWFLAAAGSTTTSIVLAESLAKVTGISPTSTGGDEARVAAYTTALNARVLIALPTKLDVSLPSVAYEEGHGATPWAANAIVIRGYLPGSRVRNYRLTRGYTTGLQLSGTYGLIIDGGFVSRLENDTGQSQFGYGIADAATKTIINNVHFHDCRHGYTTGGTRIAADESTPGTLASAIPGAGTVLNNCLGTGFGASSAPFDTHQGSRDITFNNCIATDCANYAFQLRGVGLKIINPKIRNCGLGIYAYTEYSTGNPDDDFFTAGKTLADFTSVTIISPDLEVEDEPYHFRHCTAVITGHQRVRVPNYRIWQNVGGTLRISGTSDILTTTLDGRYSIASLTAKGVFQMDEVNAAASAVFSETRCIVESGACLTIDVGAGTGNGFFFRAEAAGCRLTIDGYVRATVPTSFAAILSTTGTNDGQETGLLHYNIADNSAASGIAHNIGTSIINVRSTDGTVASDRRYTRAPVNVYTADRILGLVDAGAIVEMNITTTANTVTIPPFVDVPFPVGTIIHVHQNGSGITTIAPGSGVSAFNANGLVLANRYSVARLHKRTTNTWIVSGDLIP